MDNKEGNVLWVSEQVYTKNVCETTTEALNSNTANKVVKILFKELWVKSFEELVRSFSEWLLSAENMSAFHKMFHSICWEWNLNVLIEIEDEDKDKDKDEEGCKQIVRIWEFIDKQLVVDNINTTTKLKKEILHPGKITSVITNWFFDGKYNIEEWEGTKMHFGFNYNGFPAGKIVCKVDGKEIESWFYKGEDGYKIVGLNEEFEKPVKRVVNLSHLKYAEGPEYLNPYVNIASSGLNVLAVWFEDGETRFLQEENWKYVDITPDWFDTSLRVKDIVWEIEENFKLIIENGGKEKIKNTHKRIENPYTLAVIEKNQEHTLPLIVIYDKKSPERVQHIIWVKEVKSKITEKPIEKGHPILTAWSDWRINFKDLSIKWEKKPYIKSFGLKYEIPDDKIQLETVFFKAKYNGKEYKTCGDIDVIDCSAYNNEIINISCEWKLLTIIESLLSRADYYIIDKKVVKEIDFINQNSDFEFIESLKIKKVIRRDENWFVVIVENENSYYFWKEPETGKYVDYIMVDDTNKPVSDVYEWGEDNRPLLGRTDKWWYFWYDEKEKKYTSEIKISDKNYQVVKVEKLIDNIKPLNGWIKLENGDKAYFWYEKNEKKYKAFITVEGVKYYITGMKKRNEDASPELNKVELKELKE